MNAPAEHYWMESQLPVAQTRQILRKAWRAIAAVIVANPKTQSHSQPASAGTSTSPVIPPPTSISSASAVSSSPHSKQVAVDRLVALREKPLMKPKSSSTVQPPKVHVTTSTGAMPRSAMKGSRKSQVRFDIPETHKPRSAKNVSSSAESSSKPIPRPKPTPVRRSARASDISNMSAPEDLPKGSSHSSIVSTIPSGSLVEPSAVHTSRNSATTAEKPVSTSSSTAGDDNGLPATRTGRTVRLPKRYERNGSKDAIRTRPPSSTAGEPSTQTSTIAPAVNETPRPKKRRRVTDASDVSDTPTAHDTGAVSKSPAKSTKAKDTSRRRR